MCIKRILYMYTRTVKIMNGILVVSINCGIIDKHWIDYFVAIRNRDLFWQELRYMYLHACILFLVMTFLLALFWNDARVLSQLKPLSCWMLLLSSKGTAIVSFCVTMMPAIWTLYKRFYMYMQNVLSNSNPRTEW